MISFIARNCPQATLAGKKTSTAGSGSTRMMDRLRHAVISTIVLGSLLAAQPTFARVVDGDRIMDQPMIENLCALTFDDGPSANTPILLDMLAEYNIPATFFVLGKNARHFPAIVERMVAEGHEIGNHSWSHPNLRLMSTDNQAAQIIDTDNVLRSLGATPLYLRPPYGSFDERTIRIADQLGVSVLLWSLDSYDWKRRPENYAKLLSTRGTIYEDGALRGIFLFHDIHKSTVEDFPRIIDNLRAGGCQRFVTVSQYLAGILDPEPPMLMTRRKTNPDPAAHRMTFAAGSGPVPMARCSVPSEETEPPVEKELQLEDAQASVQTVKAF